MNKFLKRLGVSIMTLSMVVWGSGFAFLTPTYATVTEGSPIDEIQNQGIGVGPLQTFDTHAVSMKLTADASETLNTVTFTITQTAGTVTAADFDSIKLAFDTDDNDNYDVGTDVILETMTAGINVGSASTMTLGTPHSIPSAESGNFNYMLLIDPSSSIAEPDAFTISLASGTGTYGLSAGTVNAAGLTTIAIVADVTAPTVNANGGPSNLQTNVPVQALVDRGFDEIIDPSTITTSTVLLQTNTGNVQGGAPTGGNLCQQAFLNFMNLHVTCEHLSDSTPLDTSTWYTLTLTTGLKDVYGNAMAANQTYEFQTGTFAGGNQFNPPPFIEGSMPPRGGQLPVNSKVFLSFSKDMNMSSGDGQVVDTDNVQLFALDSNNAPTGNNLFTSTVGWVNGTSEVTIPLPSLTEGSKYQLIVKGDDNTDPGDGSCGGSSEPACVMSTDGQALQGGDFKTDFTAIAADTDPPGFVAITPADAATGVDRAVYDIFISFDEFIDPSTLDDTTLEIHEDINTNGLADDGALPDVLVSFDPDGRGVHLTPSMLLNANAPHIVRIVSGASGVKDVVGNQLTSDILKTFTTGLDVNGENGGDTVEPKIEFADADNQGIFITFNEPMMFDNAANATASSSANPSAVNVGGNWTIEESADSGTSWQPVAFTDQNGDMLSGKSIYYDAPQKTLSLEGLSMGPNNLFRVTASSAITDPSFNSVNGSFNVAQGTVKDAKQTGGDLGPGGGHQGGVNFFSMGTEPVRVFPRSTKAGEETQYKIEFKAATAIPAGGLIKFTFPSGFSFGAQCSTFQTDIPGNADLNGPGAGTVAVASMACDDVSRVITMTLDSVAVNAGDFLRFELEDIINSSIPKDFSTSGYTVDIKTYNGTSLLDSLTSIPFFLNAAGSRTISGKVFIDDGAGGGTAGDKIPNGTEAGVEDVDVCIGGGFGHLCTGTDSSGDYSFDELNDGFYKLNIPPLSSGSVSGGPFFRDINLNGGDSTGNNFALQTVVAQDTIDVEISTIGLDGTELDIFAFESSTSTTDGGPPTGGFVVRECTVASNLCTASLPLSPGKRYEVGIGPKMVKTPGTIPTLPEFTFMPPRPVEVVVHPSNGVPNKNSCGTGTAFDYCPTIEVLSNTAVGKVVDGSGTGIPNVFVNARPSYVEDTNGPAKAAVAQTDANGNFSLKVPQDETFILNAFMPGMPFSDNYECTVKADTGNVGTDNNSTADVNCGGVLITNDVANFTSSSLTPGNLTNDDLVLVIAKGDTSISGKVLDSDGNAIPFAHVQASKDGLWVDSPTDNSGNFTLYASAGTWTVKAFAPGFGELPPLTVTVTQGENATDQNLQVSAGDFKTITGQLLQNGDAVEGAHIHASGPCGGNGTVTDSSGNYSLKVRATGSCTSAGGDDEGYEIEGFVPGQGPTTSITSLDVTTDLASQDLTIGESGVIVAYVCTLDTPGNSPSAVNNCASDEITTAFIDAHDSNGKGIGTRANTTSGQYELTVPAGTYTVKAGDAEAGQLGSASSVVVTAGQTTYVNIAPPDLYTVSGTIASGNTACIEGSTVSLADQDNGRLILAPVASDGTYSSDQVPDGTYTVSVGKPGCVDSEDAETIEVDGGNVTQVGDSDLARTLTAADMVVEGQIQLSSTNVDFETMVVATSSGGKTVVTKVDTSKTGSDDNYTLNLTSGETWTIQARGDGYESAEISAAAATTSADMTMSAISGFTVSDAKTASMTFTQGGIVTNDDIGDLFEFNVPAGALGQSSNAGNILTKETSAVANTATQTVVGGTGIEIKPGDASGQPITTLSASTGSLPTVTIPYEEADVTAANAEEAELMIGAWSEEKQSWEPMPTTCDVDANTCTATVSHFSVFGTISTASSGGGGSSGGGSDDGVPPAAPTNVKVSTDGSKVTLTWTDPSATDLDRVEVLRNSGTGTPVLNTPLQRVSVGTQTYVDTTVTAGQTYKYMLRAKDTSENSGLTSSFSITVQAESSESSGGGGGGGSESTESSTTETDTSTSEESLGVDDTVKDVIAESENVALPTDVIPGNLVKSESSQSVYYIGQDKKRHAFMNELIYYGYFKDFSNVKTITDDELAQIQLGKNVKVRAGSWLVKIVSDPKVYAVEPGGKLRWVSSEAVAESLYGAEWNKKIIDIDVSYFVDYEIGDPITENVHPNGTLLHYLDGGPVYYLDGNKLWELEDLGLSNPHIFMATEDHGYKIGGTAEFKTIRELSMGF